MGKLLTILLLIVSFYAGATVRHVATTGNDGTGDGTSGNPYLTVAYAITQSVSGDSIFITSPGTYNVTAQMDVPTGISIFNNTATKPIIATSSAIQSIFYLNSATEGTNGNQSVSGIRFTGAGVASNGLYIMARSNVRVHDCEFDGFTGYGIYSRGGTSGGMGRPVTWATGLEFHDNIITDCGYDELFESRRWDVYGGGIHLSGSSGPQVYNNNINNGEGFGWGIRCLSDSGFIKGADIHDNIIRTHFRDTLESYSFSLEIWTGKGGNRFYRNDCNAGLDFSGYGWDDEGGYGYALDVYENTTTLDVQPTYTQESGLIFESGCTGGVYFRRNFVKNFSKGLVFSLRQNSLVQGLNGFYVDYCVFSEIGQVSGSMTGTTLEFNAVPPSGYPFPPINDFRYANCVTHRASSSPVQTYGLNCTAANGGVGATWTNVVAVNNISFNVYTPLKWDNQVIDIITIADNVFYNSTNNTRFNNCTVTNDNVEAASTSNPLFVSTTDFHLQATSTCINAGTSTGQVLDFESNTVPLGSAYDIGAYEYGGSAPTTSTYYLSPTGNDTNAGTIAAPWFSLLKAWTVVSAGDTIYLRGGTYEWIAQQLLNTTSGTAADTIRVWAYPGEQPVLTRGTGYTGDYHGLIKTNGIAYVHFRDLEITGAIQMLTGVASGLTLGNSSNMKVERLNSHHNGHGMLIYGNSGNNLVLNCDFHHNYDPLSVPVYGNADGLEIAEVPDGYDNIVRGCRSWNNSDDGYDTWGSDGHVWFDGCWAWNNGYREDGTTLGGNGNGIKLGGTYNDMSAYFKRTVTNCVAFNNRTVGFSTNSAQTKMYFYNCTAFGNLYAGFLVTGYETLAYVFRNLISYNNLYNYNNTRPPNAVISNCTYHATFSPTGPVASAADFVSVTPTGVDGARQSDSSLPLVTFLHLAGDSDLRGAGVAIAGLVNDCDGELWGTPPSIGAYEYTVYVPPGPASGFGKVGNKFGKYNGRFTRPAN